MNPVQVPGAILEVVHGSHAYGLNTATSDLDRKGIFVDSPAGYHGFADRPEQIEPEQERVFWEVRKFFELAMECNPTAIEVLFVDTEHLLSIRPAGLLLLDNRRAFLSRRAAGSFGRYALSQLKRIKTHRRWLIDPPKSQPTRVQFGLSEMPTISKDQLGAAETMIDSGRLDSSAVPPNFLSLLRQEGNFRTAMKQYQQYETWKKERNPTRAALEAKFGYDTKHAMHLVRLLRMGLEILRDGEVIVKRPKADAKELLEIRGGSMTYDQLVGTAEFLSAAVDESAKTSQLPEAPDAQFLNGLCVQVVEEAHRCMKTI